MISRLREQKSRQPAQRERCIAQGQRFISIRTLMAEGTLRITCRHLNSVLEAQISQRICSEIEIVESWEKETFPLTNMVIEF